MNTKDLILALAERLVWIAPVGNRPDNLRGFMVCKRTVNNVDSTGNTRVDYLMINGGWKKPFCESRSRFATFDDALLAAIKVEKIGV